MEKVLAHIHVTKCYESYRYIFISYHHKLLHLCVVRSQWVSCRSMIFSLRRQHVLCQSKLIFHHLILQVYLRDTRHQARRPGWWTSPRRHCLPRVHQSIEQSIPSKKQSTVVRSRISHFFKLNKRLHLTVHVHFHLWWHRQSGHQWAHSASQSLHRAIWSLYPYTFPAKRSKL
jgi:hypothetical protein